MKDSFLLLISRLNEFLANDFFAKVSLIQFLLRNCLMQLLQLIERELSRQ